MRKEINEEKRVIYCYKGTKQEPKRELKLGNLYVYDDTDKREIYDPPAEVIDIQPSFLFDSNRKNVHMFPKNINDAKTYSYFILKKANEINEHIIK